jgi:hypothetical protein
MKVLALTLLALSCNPTPNPVPEQKESAPGCVIDAIYHMPNPQWTPGALCTEGDTDFDGFRYKAHVAHCGRSITMSEKDKVAQLYGIPKTDYYKYEFDHFFPLNAGGSNSAENLWPQPLDEAKLKDRVEEEVYNGLRHGTMTQDEAVAKIRSWRSPACPN